MKTIFMIIEYAGMGTGYKYICAYENESLAKEHLDLIIKLAPETGSKFEIKELSLKDKVL